MNERWKYQIKIGLFWGVFMTLFNILFELQEHPIMEQITKPSFYFRAISMIIVGVFVLGYFNWKSIKKL
jgi:hypothetical protein